MAPHTDRFVRADVNGGWGFATFVIVLAAVLCASAAYIHNKSYKHPTDVTWVGGSGGMVK